MPETYGNVEVSGGATVETSQLSNSADNIEPLQTSHEKLTIERFIEQHPSVTTLDLILFDMNGVVRGKRVPVSQLNKVLDQGICLPASVFALDICGETVEETGLGFEKGDGDRICRMVASSLTTTPWQENSAQAIVTMYEPITHQPFFADPRHVLEDQLAKFSAKGLNPCVAVELEFYLQDLEPDEAGNPQPPLMPISGERMTQTQVYSLEELDEFKAFLDEVISTCEQQNIPADNITAEYAPGQFEVNLKHTNDVLLACDQAMLLKRVVRAVAKKHGFYANFMAKPYTEYAGNGCHIHISLQDSHGNNVFGENEQLLLNAIAGVLAHLEDSMAIFAPNANSYRRLQPNMFVPLHATWGWDNRTVAVRVPASGIADKRIEHRLSGADVNPYLTVAVLLASILDGLENELTPPAPIEGDASLLELPMLPISWDMSLHEFENSQFMKNSFGEEFCKVYLANKKHEQARFSAQVSPLEYKWYK
ncbi:glutamine synthetase family protein [Vibrio hangzhouensis]|uniref:Glutamate--putrescine ligase n=1 Tax=Vibrio hangzhouensis TaxID=462991 RepID=A0A1H6B059_9VIBR|nr:glutamate--putrescine ligase [Vibrio hangzhouensis]